MIVISSTGMIIGLSVSTNILATIAIFSVVASVDSKVILPEIVPLAEALTRIYIVSKTVPETGPSVILVEKLDDAEELTSKPVGAVTIILDNK